MSMMFNRRPACAIVVAAVAMVAAGGGKENAGASVDELSEADLYEVDYLADAYGIPYDQALEQVSKNPYVAELSRQLSHEEDFPEGFAGLWRENNTGTVYIGHTGDSPSAQLALIRNESPIRSDVQFVGRKHELQYLIETSSEISTLRSKNSDNVDYEWLHYSDVDVLIVDNRIHFSNPTSQLLDQAKTELDRLGFDLDVFSFRVAEPSKTEVCTSRTNCDEVMRGGLRIAPEATPTSSRCTSGFQVRQGVSVGTLTAGHCANTRWIRPAGGHFGTTHGARITSGAADVQFIRHISSLNASNWVYRSDLNRRWPVTSIFPWSDIWTGMNVCQTGSSTNGPDNSTGPRGMCGTIATKYYPPSSITSPEPRFVKARYCSRGGDSGSAVINSNRAVGIHTGNAPADSGVPPRSHCDLNRGRFAFFTSVTYATQATGTTVRTN